MNDLSQKHCVPCEGDAEPLTVAEAQKFLSSLHDWQLSDDACLLSKTIVCKDFVEALGMANKIGEIAERENHHPDLSVSWGKLGITLSTHAITGLSENDFILAAKIDKMLE